MNMRKLAVAATCAAIAFAPFIESAAGNAANPDAIELVPVPWPVKYKGGPDAPVAFDATTTVVVDCPDAVAADWLAAHFREWYGKAAPLSTNARRIRTTSTSTSGSAPPVPTCAIRSCAPTGAYATRTATFPSPVGTDAT